MNIQSFFPLSDLFNSGTLSKLITSLFIILGIVLLRHFFLRIILQRLETLEQRYKWNKGIQTAAIILAIVCIGPIWIAGFQNTATYLGLLTAGLAITLQEVIQNLAAWIAIISLRPFKVGDRIQIGTYIGDVIALGALQFTLIEVGNWVDADQNTGRVLHIPNNMAFKQVLANYYSGVNIVWNEIAITITHGSNWQKAKNLLEEIAAQQGNDIQDNTKQQMNSASNQYLVNYSNLSSSVYITITDRGITITMRYICEPRQRRSSAQAVWEEILTSFSDHKDIVFVQK
jgi:small-conductance mechanosensitive channel